MISSMNDKEKATLLEVVTVATTGISSSGISSISSTGISNSGASSSISTTGISTTSVSSATTSSSNSSIEYDHRILTKLLQSSSSSSIKVTGGCDDYMYIYINGTHVSTQGNPPVYFNPTTDTLAIRGLDAGGHIYYCRIFFNDIQLSLAVVNNHFKCTYKDNLNEDLPAGWMDKDYDDSFWGGVYQTPWGNWWAEGLNHDYGGIFCRYHPVGFCEDGSEPYGGQCWCSRGYKSANGMAPCDPCDDNAYTDAVGSTMCRCAANAFSSTGYDTPNSCESCPG